MQTRYNRKARLGFMKLKLIILLPLLGFAMIPLMSRGVPNLISILIDTSSSMDSERLDKTSLTISNTMSENEANEHVVLSWFDNSKDNPPRKTSLKEISNEINPDKLCGNHRYFSDVTDAVTFFRSGEMSEGDDTPLIETLWGHFRFAESRASRSDFGKIVLIILSDGDERSLDSKELVIDEFYCFYDEFANYYDEIIFINFSGSNDSPFFDLAEGCGFKIIDGREIDTYATAITEVLEEYQSNHHFIYLLFIVYIITAMFFLLITPKR
jgi:hypothetical protein